MATTKVFRRLAATVLTVVAAWYASPSASAGGNWMPLLPDQDFYDFQMFAPPDSQDYEIYSELSEGIFFNYDRLYWAITPASVTGVGQTKAGGYLIPTSPISPQAIAQLNNGSIQASGTAGGNVIGGIFIFGSDPLQLDLNTSWMRTIMTWGNRYEGGWIYDDQGMQFSYFNTGAKSQEFQTLSEFAASSPTQIFTQSTTGGGGDGGGGGGIGNINQALATTTITSNSPPPDHVIAQKLTQTNTTEISGGAAALIVRRELGRRGSGNSARFGIGPRYMQFAESFNIGYESNQYAFNRGPTGVGQNTGAGGATGGTTTTGGGIGAGSQSVFVGQSSAGDVIGIGGYDTLTGLGQSSPLQTGAWETNSYNNMVGPEFALLLEGNAGRWTFSSEFKFTAAINWQNNLFRGANFPDSIGADYLRATFNPSVTNSNSGGGTTAANDTVQLQPPPLFLQIYGVGQQNASNAAEHSVVFSPIGEWRFGAQYRVTQSILLRAGYTGMWLGSIARASSNTAYRGERRSVRYAEVKDPTQPASLTNPWVVKTTGPTGETPVTDPYYRPDPVYNRIGPAAQVVQDYVFTNGVDFGIEVKY